jgi:peroxiredoxin
MFFYASQQPVGRTAHPTEVMSPHPAGRSMACVTDRSAVPTTDFGEPAGPLPGRTRPAGAAPTLRPTLRPTPSGQAAWSGSALPTAAAAPLRQVAPPGQAAPPMPGQAAPDFSLPSGPEEELSLSRLRGAPVVLAFYPADFSPVCSDQMTLYQAIEPEFTRLRATVVGVSVDGTWCHQAFAARGGIRYPLLSDFEPKGAVCREYGVYDPDAGTAQRALFVLDDEGVVAWNYLSESGVNPGADGILAALEQLDGKRAKAS